MGSTANCSDKPGHRRSKQFSHCGIYLEANGFGFFFPREIAKMVHLRNNRIPSIVQTSPLGNVSGIQQNNMPGGGVT